jgi:hypothetical protein
MGCDCIHKFASFSKKPKQHLENSDTLQVD